MSWRSSHVSEVSLLTGINSDMFGSLSLILETHNIAQLWAGVHLQTSELVNFGEALHWRRF